MTEPKAIRMDKWWVQLIITLAMVLVSVSVAWGAYSSRLTTLEKQVEQNQKDHDLLVSLDTKMTIIMKNIDEIKVDIKKK